MEMTTPEIKRAKTFRRIGLLGMILCGIVILPIVAAFAIDFVPAFKNLAHMTRIENGMVRLTMIGNTHIDAPLEFWPAFVAGWVMLCIGAFLLWSKNREKLRGWE
jgi:hypothetical protein